MHNIHKIYCCHSKTFLNNWAEFLGGVWMAYDVCPIQTFGIKSTHALMNEMKKSKINVDEREQNQKKLGANLLST